MIRLLCIVALVTSVAILGCSTADEGNEGAAGSSVDPPLGGGGSVSAGGAGAGGMPEGGGNPDDPCPEDVTCVTSLPFTDSSTTTGGNELLDGYGCAPEVNEAGPERVYRVDVAEEGLLVASLDGLGAGVDVDVHILQELNASACIDRGHWDAAALLSAGRFWIVVDSWVDDSGISQEGSYELTISLTAANDYAAEGLHPSVLTAALLAFDRAWVNGDTIELEYGIIDFVLPSIEPRFFVLDLRKGQLLYRELATHGEGSQDPNDLTLTGSMSNVVDSHASSLGLVLTAEPYNGANGYSLRLDGLEPGFNDNDRDRAIVVHGADYATQDFVNANGYLGRSWGCPATDPAISDEIIDTLQDGRLLLKYFDDSAWLNNSAYLSP